MKERIDAKFQFRSRAAPPAPYAVVHLGQFIGQILAFNPPVPQWVVTYAAMRDHYEIGGDPRLPLASGTPAIPGGWTVKLTLA